MDSKLAGAVSLCRKAGRLAAGGDAAQDAIYSGKADLVLLAKDLSERSARKLQKICGEKGIPCLCLAWTMADLASYTGKEYGIFAVCDPGFAKMIGDAAAAAASLDIE